MVIEREEKKFLERNVSKMKQQWDERRIRELERKLRDLEQRVYNLEKLRREEEKEEKLRSLNTSKDYQ